MASPRPLGITLIAVGKLVKVVVLLAAAALAFDVAHGSEPPPDKLIHWANLLRIDPQNHHLDGVITKLSGVSARRLAELGFGSLLYAALFAVEGLGLWLQRRWAEWFSIGITISFVPLEIIEIVRAAHPVRVVTLVLNLVAVLYLLLRVRRRKAGHEQADTAHRSP